MYESHDLEPSSSKAVTYPGEQRPAFQKLDFSSMAAVTTFFSIWRCRIWSSIFRKSAPWDLGHGVWVKLSTGARNICAASMRDSGNLRRRQPLVVGAHQPIGKRMEIGAAAIQV